MQVKPLKHEVKPYRRATEECENPECRARDVITLWTRRHGTLCEVCWAKTEEKQVHEEKSK